MRFDDRLMTVLDQPAERPARPCGALAPAGRPRRARRGPGRQIRWSTRRLQLIRSDRPQVDDALRSAAARAVAALPLPYELVALFASDKLAVSAPMLAAARLEPRSGNSCCGLADDETRQFIATLHPDIAARPPAEVAVDVAAEVEPFVEAGHHARPGHSVDQRRRRAHRAVASRPDAAAAAASRPTTVSWPLRPARRRCFAGNAALRARSPGSRVLRAGR